MIDRFYFSMHSFNYIAIAISIAGSIVIIWGACRTALQFALVEWNKILKKPNSRKDESIRYEFGSYLLLGLDFMLAADMIHTIHNPVLNELYVLALIVAIRSIISYFLRKEISNERDSN